MKKNGHWRYAVPVIASLVVVGVARRKGKMDTITKDWWNDLRTRACTMASQLSCAVLLCALAYTGSIPGRE